MTTTYRAYVDHLEALSITGVERQYTQGPPVAQVAPADCPFQYVRYPGGDEVPVVFGEQGGLPTLRAELVVGVEPVGQNVTPENFDDTVDMMDNVTAALRSSACLPKSHKTWTIRQAIDPVAGQEYWAVIAVVEGKG